MGSDPLVQRLGDDARAPAGTGRPAGGGRRIALYATGAVLVRLADEGARVAMTLLALQRTGKAGLGGVLVAVLLVPHVVAAPLVGLLTDRARRPRLVVAGLIAVFGLTLAATAAGLGRAPLPVVLAVLLLGGCCGPAVTGALSSLLPRLLEPDGGPSGLAQAFGLDSLTYNTAGIAGPALTAVLAGVLSPTAATYALAVSAVGGAGLVALLPLRAEPTVRADTSTGAASGARAGLLAGVRAIVRDPVLATVTAATSLGQVGAGFLPVVAAVLASRWGHPATAGWLLTAVAAGGLLGSLLWTWRPAPTRLAARVVLVGLLGTGVPLLLGALLGAAAAPSLVLLVVLFALSGACNGPLFGALLVVRQDRAPDQVRSQVFTLGAGAKLTANAAGAALAGAVAGSASSWQLLLAGAFPVVAGAVGAMALHHVPAVAGAEHPSS